jgi:hypothetical protein
MLTALVELNSLFQSMLDVLRMFCLLFLTDGSGIPAALGSEASRVVTQQGAVALLQYVYMSHIHRDKEGKLRTTYMERF